MVTLPRSMRRFQTARWWVQGPALPLAWAEGLRQLEAADARDRTPRSD